MGRIGASVGRNKAAGARAEHRALQEMMYLRSRPQVVPDDWVVEGSAAEDWSLEAVSATQQQSYASRARHLKLSLPVRCSASCTCSS